MLKTPRHFLARTKECEQEQLRPHLLPPSCQVPYGWREGHSSGDSPAVGSSQGSESELGWDEGLSRQEEVAGAEPLVLLRCASYLFYWAFLAKLSDPDSNCSTFLHFGLLWRKSCASGNAFFPLQDMQKNVFDAIFECCITQVESRVWTGSCTHPAFPCACSRGALGLGSLLCPATSFPPLNMYNNFFKSMQTFIIYNPLKSWQNHHSLNIYCAKITPSFSRFCFKLATSHHFLLTSNSYIMRMKCHHHLATSTVTFTAWVFAGSSVQSSGLYGNNFVPLFTFATSSEYYPIACILFKRKDKNCMHYFKRGII